MKHEKWQHLFMVASLLLFVTACGKDTEQVVIPQTFFSEVELGEIMAELEVDEKTKVTINDDADLVYEMPKEAYDEIMAKLGTGIDEMIHDVLSDETITAVTSIEVSEDYDTYDSVVERTVFDESFQGMFTLGLRIKSNV